jgi:hypothetical protein
MSEENQENQNNTASIITIVLVIAIPLFYVLSIGPVLAVVKKSRLPKKPFGIIYSPVVWLADNTPLKKPLYKYAELWGWR